MSDGERCRHCGRSLAPAAQFCGGCGIPVAAAEVLTPGPGGADIPTMAVPSTDPGSEYPDDPYYWEPRRRVLPWVAAVVVVGLITGGIILAASSGDGGVGSGHDGPIAMPSVVTYQLSEALSILEREGVDAKQVTVTRVPRLNMGPGTVFEQDPQPGINVFDGVRLTVSRAPDKMPDFVGRGINAARATLTTLDVKVTIQDLLDPTHTDGTVLEQTPPKDAPFANAVRLTGFAQADPHQPRRPHRHRDRADRDGRDDRGNRVPAQPGVGHIGVPRAPPVSVAYALDGHYRKLLATTGLGPDTPGPRRPRAPRHQRRRNDRADPQSRLPERARPWTST